MQVPVRTRLIVVIALAVIACGDHPSEPQAAAPEAPQETPAPPAEPAKWVGSAACAECHAEVAAKWRDSHHARAMQKASAETALGTFANASFRDGRVTWKFERNAEQLRVRSEGAESGSYEVAYTLGVEPLQQLLIPFPDGRLQPLHVAWDARPAASGGARWFSLAGAEHVAAGDPAHWKSPEQSANATCAECHTTGFHKGFDLAANRYDSTWSEAGVGCEACHGAGSRHVAWARAGAKAGGDRGLGVALAKSSAPGPNPEIETCAPCHSQRARIAEDPRAGDAFLDGYAPVLLDGSVYHDDGSLADEAYQWGSFVQSRMYAAGVRCSDCHEPHGGKLRAQGNTVCAGCHEPARFDAPEHHHHTASPTPTCVDCHMTSRGLLSISTQHDHAFSVPRPDLSVAIGTPNACSTCHAKRGEAWAAKAVESWRGSAAPRSHFATRLHARGAGGSAAGQDLAALVGDADAPAIARATALLELGGAPQRDLIEKAARTGDPLLHFAAARTAAGLAQSDRVAAATGLLSDPHRAVRIEAASALADVADEVFTQPQRAARDRALDELRAAQSVAADSPVGQVNIAQLRARQGDAKGAEEAFLAALRLGDYFTPAYVGLADLFESQKHPDDALALLRKGAARVPDSADLHYALGLLHGRRNEPDPALRELGAAVRLAPDASYYAYVYAVALNEAGRAKDALAALRTAVARHPADQNLLGATALIARDAGRYDEALAAAKRLAELFPDQPEPHALVEEIEHRRAGGPAAPAPVTPVTPE
jgi:predicted CXXCH cytochrome family protein